MPSRAIVATSTGGLDELQIPHRIRILRLQLRIQGRRLLDGLARAVAVDPAIRLDIIGSGSVLRSAVICFYISNEGISIIENAARIGLPVPEQLRALLEQLKKK